jgi:hypothetical protein
MVADFLARDWRSSGLFRAVFSYQEAEEARFKVEGTVEEFLEIDEKDGPKASMGLIVTLVDLSQRDVASRVVLQNRYWYTEPMVERSAAGLARGISRALEKGSATILQDLYRAIQNAMQ